MSSIAGESSVRILRPGDVGDGGIGLTDLEDNEEGMGLVDREDGRIPGEGRGLRVDELVREDKGVGELGASYVGGGTKEALMRSLVLLPASRAACRSLAYLSWKVRRILISIATALRSAEIPLSLALGGWVMGGRLQMIRARSCWCSGTKDWISGTV